MDRIAAGGSGRTRADADDLSAKLAHLDELAPEDRQRIAAMARQWFADNEAIASWRSLEPEFVEIYTATFTQDEIDAQIAFYGSPAGQAVLAKSPDLVARQQKLFMRRWQDSMKPLGRILAAFSKAGRQARAREAAAAASRPASAAP